MTPQCEPTMTDDTARIPHHQLCTGDVLRWQCSKFPHVIHRWRVRSICLGAVGQESLIEMESLTHKPGYSAEFEAEIPLLVVPEVLVRDLEIEDIGGQFGVPRGHADGT